MFFTISFSNSSSPVPYSHPLCLTIHFLFLFSKILFSFLCVFSFSSFFFCSHFIYFFYLYYFSFTHKIFFDVLLYAIGMNIHEDFFSPSIYAILSIYILPSFVFSALKSKQFPPQFLDTLKSYLLPFFYTFLFFF